MGIKKVELLVGSRKLENHAISMQKPRISPPIFLPNDSFLYFLLYRIHYSQSIRLNHFEHLERHQYSSRGGKHVFVHCTKQIVNRNTVFRNVNKKSHFVRIRKKALKYA